MPRVMRVELYLALHLEQAVTGIGLIAELGTCDSTS